jgi:hypothetical protein
VAFFEKSLAYLEMSLAGKLLAPGVTKKGEAALKPELMEAALQLGKSSCS